MLFDGVTSAVMTAKTPVNGATPISREFTGCLKLEPKTIISNRAPSIDPISPVVGRPPFSFSPLITKTAVNPNPIDPVIRAVTSRIFPCLNALS